MQQVIEIKLAMSSDGQAVFTPKKLAEYVDKATHNLGLFLSCWKYLADNTAKDADEQKALRQKAFELRQQLAHADAEAKKARDVADAKKAEEAAASAAAEVRTHVVPTAASIADFVAAAEA